MSDHDRLLDLCSRFLDGEITEEEKAELSGRLDGDPDARKTLARLVHQHGNLHWLMGRTPLEADVPPPSTSRIGTVRTRNRRQQSTTAYSPIIWMSAAAVFAVVLLGALLSTGGSPVAPPSAPAEARRPQPMPSAPPRVADRRPRPSPPADRPPVPGARPKAERKVAMPSSKPRPALPAKPDPPAPTVPAPSRPRKTEAAPARVLAALDRVGERSEVREGQEIRAGGNPATLVFDDGTRVSLLPGAVIARISDRERNAGKYLELSRGKLEANVTRQPAGRPLVIVTPRARARVVGTRFTLDATPDFTRLEVTEGKVRLSRPNGIASVLVSAGYFAVAAPGKPLEAEPIPTLVARISFGPAGAPVPPGFLPDSGAAFDPQRSYGWEQDRSAGTRLRTGTQPLLDRRSIIAGSALEEARWEYALPNGVYAVTVVCGGELTSQGPHRISVEGTDLFKDVFSAKGEHPSRKCIVKVQDGRLTLRCGAVGTSLRAADGTHDTIINTVTVSRIR